MRVQLAEAASRCRASLVLDAGARTSPSETRGRGRRRQRIMILTPTKGKIPAVRVPEWLSNDAQAFRFESKPRGPRTPVLTRYAACTTPAVWPVWISASAPLGGAAA